MAKNGSIPPRNKKETVFLTDRQMDRQTESTTKNNRLLGQAQRSIEPQFCINTVAELWILSISQITSEQQSCMEQVQCLDLQRLFLLKCESALATLINYSSALYTVWAKKLDHF